MENDYRTVAFSQTSITELMIPAYANFGGKVHGGILLSMMDKVAYACASKHASNYCVTVSVDQVDFWEPVEVGDMVTMLASVNYVGRTSMVVGIKVISENFKKGTSKHTNSSYFTMVAKDDSGKPTMVPGLILETSVQVKRFLKAIKQKEINKQNAEQMREARRAFLSDSESSILKHERCRVMWNLELIVENWEDRILNSPFSILN